MRLIRRSISAGRGAPQMPRTRGPRQLGVGRSVIAGSAPRARTARFFCFASAVCYISQPRRGLPLSAFIFGRLLRSGPSPRGLGNARAVSYALFFFLLEQSSLCSVLGDLFFLPDECGRARCEQLIWAPAQLVNQSPDHVSRPRPVLVAQVPAASVT